jgi:hypothetical protein
VVGALGFSTCTCAVVCSTLCGAASSGAVLFRCDQACLLTMHDTNKHPWLPACSPAAVYCLGRTFFSQKCSLSRQDPPPVPTPCFDSQVPPLAGSCSDGDGHCPLIGLLGHLLLFTAHIRAPPQAPAQSPPSPLPTHHTKYQHPPTHVCPTTTTTHAHLSPLNPPPHTHTLSPPLHTHTHSQVPSLAGSRSDGDGHCPLTGLLGHLAVPGPVCAGGL